MSRLLRRFVIIGIILVCIITACYFTARYPGYRLTGFAAKQACSLVNITGQSMDDVKGELLEDNSFMKFVTLNWDSETGTVHATVFGLFRNTAVYRPPLGAVLVYPGYEEKINSFPRPKIPPTAAGDDLLNPFIKLNETDDAPFTDIDQEQLNKALAYAFDERSDSKFPRHTRAILAIWRNHIIAERYAPDFSVKSLLIGWSMTKSILNLAIGRRIHQGFMSLDATELRPE